MGTLFVNCWSRASPHALDSPVAPALTPGCWAECHDTVVSVVSIPSYAHNVAPAIGPNCKTASYIETMSTCLAARCESAPDAAYAAEFATSVCKRAGVDVEVVLPESYLASAAEYFE